MLLDPIKRQMVVEVLIKELTETTAFNLGRFIMDSNIYLEDIFSHKPI